MTSGTVRDIPAEAKFAGTFGMFARRAKTFGKTASSCRKIVTSETKIERSSARTFVAEQARKKLFRTVERSATTHRKYSKAKKTCNRVTTNCNHLGKNSEKTCVADKS